MAIIIGGFGFLMENVLTKPGEIFGEWPTLVHRITGNREDYMNWWQYWLYRIAYKCGKCVAGNIALIYYTINQLDAVFCGVVIAIITAHFLKKLDG